MARFRLYSKNGSSWLFRSEWADAQAAAAAGKPCDAIGYCIAPDGYTPTTLGDAPSDGGTYFLWFRFGRAMAWTKYSGSSYASIAAALVDAVADTSKTGGSVDFIAHPSTRTPDADLPPMYRIVQ